MQELKPCIIDKKHNSQTYIFIWQNLDFYNFIEINYKKHFLHRIL